MSYHPSTTTSHAAVVWTALAGETGDWVRNQDRWRFFLDPVEPRTAIAIYDTGRVRVAGRLADKVRHLGGTPFSHVGYVGLQWTVR